MYYMMEVRQRYVSRLDSKSLETSEKVIARSEATKQSSLNKQKNEIASTKNVSQ